MNEPIKFYEFIQETCRAFNQKKISALFGLYESVGKKKGWTIYIFCHFDWENCNLLIELFGRVDISLFIELNSKYRRLNFLLASLQFLASKRREEHARKNAFVMEYFKLCFSLCSYDLKQRACRNLYFFVLPQLKTF